MVNRPSGPDNYDAKLFKEPRSSDPSPEVRIYHGQARYAKGIVNQAWAARMAGKRASRRGLINVGLNRLVAAGTIASFRTNYETRHEPDRVRITVVVADGADTAT